MPNSSKSLGMPKGNLNHQLIDLRVQLWFSRRFQETKSNLKQGRLRVFRKLKMIIDWLRGLPRFLTREGIIAIFRLREKKFIRFTSCTLKMIWILLSRELMSRWTPTRSSKISSRIILNNWKMRTSSFKRQSSVTRTCLKIQSLRIRLRKVKFKLRGPSLATRTLF